MFACVFAQSQDYGFLCFLRHIIFLEFLLCFVWVDVDAVFFSLFLIKAIYLCLKFDLKLMLLCLLFFSLVFFLFCVFVLQFNYISASRSRCKILFGFCTNATIDNDNYRTGIWSKSVACVAWPRRPMGSSGTCSWHHSIIFTERYRLSARRFTRSISGKRRTQGMLRALL